MFVDLISVSQHSANSDPSDALWSQTLAMAYGRLGSALETQGNSAGAESAFREYVAKTKVLAEHNEKNIRLQHELAVAHSRLGAVLEAQGRLKEAGVRPWLTRS